MEIKGKVLEIFEPKEINATTIKKEILIEYNATKTSVKKAIISHFIPKDEGIFEAQVGKTYIFTICINARQLQSGKWVNNLDIRNIKSAY